MSKLERLEILVRSGGMTEEQAERARKKLREMEAAELDGSRDSDVKGSADGDPRVSLNPSSSAPS
jgi:hypothetical protein